ncbi:MarR family winged helix-turn-helix transcriptional regulator [Gemella cuniculi]|uniref:MarR family winged helix-turn-helix transcriptional regulator n=1 Tax=Gemella cuniculi TaxID=150240 RepID=UPI00040BA50E|nr:MarR family winged helix-turn-helix transcriptional regulator [Gemella cuniculi]
MEIKEFGELLYNLKIIDQRLINIFEEEIGVSLTRYQILMYLNEVSICTQRKLGEFLKIDAAAITRHLKILENKGYIIRCRNEKNNREIYVKVTNYAKSEIKKCDKNTNIRDIINEKFTDEDLKNLVKLLSKFSENIK